MIKGVNKLIIEINNTENAYFEKAILFLRDSAADTDGGELRRNADAFLRRMTPSRKPKFRLPFAVLLISAAGLGAAATAIIALLIG